MVGTGCVKGRGGSDRVTVTLTTSLPSIVRGPHTAVTLPALVDRDRPCVTPRSIGGMDSRVTAITAQSTPFRGAPSLPFNRRNLHCHTLGRLSFVGSEWERRVTREWTHDGPNERTEMDGVRKEKEMLTAFVTLHVGSLSLSFVPYVTQGSYGKDSSAGRLTLHHCICRSR